MSEHTKEPWLFKDNIVYAMSADGMIAECSSEGNARRIVSAVNACAGIATRDLETKPLFTDGYMVMFEEVTKQRDELLAALKDLHKAYRMAVGLHSGQDDAYTVRSHNAIAKVKS